ncbi:hypothetical protein GCM10011506_22710 [Marivirga lumbricoides]|uniref:Uncharacterized protein n=1 Tax=Marivirga lumbricoides TaxID=1046115 RepID=A0ABQ1M8T0_9BACT|nr:hypothetical protein GCM10011506_22710 [Marivirga lumbricoides]
MKAKMGNNNNWQAKPVKIALGLIKTRAKSLNFSVSPMPSIIIAMATGISKSEKSGIWI